ncbi:MAG: hypothetical protein H6735_13945 [Alphaproteobacteria bacterium]|nr:hypothetical protein [Alphaproteobacteria bacterium]
MSARFLSATLLLATGCGEMLPSIPLLTKTTEGAIEVELLDTEVLPGLVEDADFDVKLYDERVTWYLGTYIDTDAWGPVLLADAELRSQGEDALFELRVDDLRWDHVDPLVLTLTPGTRYGWTTRADAGTEIVQPASCTMVVTSSTTDAEHAADLTDCLRDWAELNGSPAGLSLDVEGVSDAADWAYAAHWTLGTARPVEAACTGPQIAGPIDQSAFRNAQVDTLDLWGNVTAEGDVNVFTWENTFMVGDPMPTAGGLVHRKVDGGTSGALTNERTFPANWASRSLDSLADPMGFVDACAVVVHESTPDHVDVRFAATVSWSL